MAVRRERMVNDASTTLNGTINATTTSVVVSDASVFPSTGDYRLLVDSEILLATHVSANTLTVERAQEGTTGATHNSGDTIKSVFTAGALDQMMDDAFAGHTDRRPCKILDKDGNTLTVSDFTWVNQGTSTANDVTWGGITMRCPVASADHMRMLKMSAPSTPWTLTCKFELGPGYNSGGGGNSSYYIIFARESDTGKLVSIESRVNDSSRARKYSDYTTYNGEYATIYCDTAAGWLQMEDDGTDLYFRVSQDGINFFTVHSVSRTDYLTSAGPDEVGFALNSSGGEGDEIGHIYAWVLE